MFGKSWCAIGDSITRGAGNNERSYVEIISDLTGIRGTNKGISGSGYYNGNGGTQQFYNRLVNDFKQYDLYTIMGSVNDGNAPLGNYDDVGTDTLAGCINKTINAILTQNPSAKIGIISMLPINSRNATIEGLFRDITDLQMKIAKYWSIPYLNLFDGSNLRPWDGFFNQTYYYNADGCHPNEKGYMFFLNKIIEFLKSI